MKRFSVFAGFILCLSVLFSCGERAAETTAAYTAPAVTLTMDTGVPLEEPTLYTLRFVAAGDNMAYFGNVRDAEKNARGTGKAYDFTPSYTDVKKFIADYDLRFINQETLMCGEGFDLSYYPRFNSPQELGEAVVDAGFNIIGLANNHMLDMGERGLLATLDYWDTKTDVTHIGSYHNRDEFEDIKVIEKNGISVALLSFTYGTNGISLRDGAEAYIPYLDEEIVKEKVLAAEKLADLTVVSVHWGNENTFTPTAEQRKYANLITECGGDVILGHHSHCLQPIEWIEAGDNRALCIFSLGNFMSEMAEDYNILGGMLTFTVEKCGEGGKAVVTEPLFYPTVFDYTRTFYNNHIYLLTEYTEAQAKAHGIAYYGNHTTLSRLYGYVQKVIDKAFLPDEVANYDQ
ncbi:MAG: CapA family protein [Clostridia bacterium]|nr:CapA family protein [Clostridia bacterium]